jgi:uncharacterized protein YdaU (DUF1376 family)
VNYYPHHIGDYAKDTRALSQAEHGAYRLLIDEAYSSENGVDAEEVYAISCAHTAVERKNTDRVLTKFFTLRDGRYYQKRIDEEVASYQEKSAKASASAMRRWSKGNANAMPTHNKGTCESDAESMLPITNNQEPKKEKTKAQPQAAFVCPDWVPSEAWDGWVAMRKAKRTPNSLHALELAVKTLDGLRQSGFDPKDVLDQSTVRGWTGLFEVKKHTDANSMKPRFAPERDFKTIDYRAGVKPDGRF